jgi:hypothetical protein
VATDRASSATARPNLASPIWDQRLPGAAAPVPGDRAGAVEPDDVTGPGRGRAPVAGPHERCGRRVLAVLVGTAGAATAGVSVAHGRRPRVERVTVVDLYASVVFAASKKENAAPTYKVGLDFGSTAMDVDGGGVVCAGGR